MYKKLEDEIRESFNKKSPFSLLSNIVLYRNDRDTEDLFANEIDYLFHYKKNKKNYLVIVEVKQRKIYGDGSAKSPTRASQWQLNYDGKIKNIKKQVLDQGVALKQFCRVLTEGEDLKSCIGLLICVRELQTPLPIWKILI